MPTELTGPVEYGVMKHGFGGGVNPGLGSSLDSMAYGSPTKEQLASTLLHECYGHQVLGSGHADQDRETIMTSMSHLDSKLGFTEEEEEVLRREIEITSHIKHGIEYANGFYTGPSAVYKPNDYYDVDYRHARTDRGRDVSASAGFGA